MPDSLYTLGPVTPSTWYDGDITDSPGSTELILRSLKIVNTDHSRDAWFWLGNTGLVQWFFDRYLSGIYVPAGTTRVLDDLDIVLTAPAGDFYCLKQVSDQTNSTLAVSSAVSFVSSGSATTFTTGSWSSSAIATTGECYVMFISVKGGNRNISSFTDTHTGITWTKISEEEITGGGNRLYTYVGHATGATSTTTAVNFSGSNSSCIISIIKLQNTGITSAFPALAVCNAGTEGYVPIVATDLIGVNGRDVCGGRLLACFENAAGATSVPVGDLIELHDLEVAADSHSLWVGYSKRPGTNAWMRRASATTGDKVASLVDIHDTYSPLSVTISGVKT